MQLENGRTYRDIGAITKPTNCLNVQIDRHLVRKIGARTAIEHSQYNRKTADTRSIFKAKV